MKLIGIKIISPSETILSVLPVKASNKATIQSQ